MARNLTFTVDSKLLEELGERLVGKPSTALAELVKNSYDADATVVKVILDTSGDGQLEVLDNGHGMTFKEFRDYWMRLGSQHKRYKKGTRNFGRPFTGSKGVGRVAAQLLSKRLRVISVSDRDPTVRLIASLDWEKAVATGDLVDVEVQVREQDLSEPASPGTTLILSNLRQDWSQEKVKGLAKEIWQLQPPFDEAVPREEATAKDFKVEFGGPEEDLVEAFDEQMQAILRLWSAKAKGINEEGEAKISLQFKGEDPQTFEFEIEDCKLKNGRFEIRFYELEGRQPHGIRVNEARQYLQEFGGVHIYDTGFRLPYYGEKDNDWLLISHDTSRRLALSSLLPQDMQVERGMLSLPRWQQVLGIVEINTSEEPLEITITRDRLVESQAFAELRDLVRRAIHWYANVKKKQQLSRETREGGEEPAPSSKVEQLEHVIETYSDDIPVEIQEKLRTLLSEARSEVDEQVKSAKRRIGALSSFATAGISAVGYQHEINKQLLAIENLTEKIGTILESPHRADEDLEELRAELLEWVHRARQTGKMFSHLTEPENVEGERRYDVRDLVKSVVDQIQPIRQGAEIDLSGLNSDLRLPRGTYTEWVSVYQNAFFNALNAMVDADRRHIRIRSDESNSRKRVMIDDTGVGIDLAESERLFEPFERKITISATRRELGFGGTGLGLTIIKMITAQKGVEVYFEEPPADYATSLVLEWEE